MGALATQATYSVVNGVSMKTSSIPGLKELGGWLSMVEFLDTTQGSIFSLTSSDGVSNNVLDDFPTGIIGSFTTVITATITRPASFSITAKRAISEATFGLILSLYGKAQSKADVRGPERRGAAASLLLFREPLRHPKTLDHLGTMLVPHLRNQPLH